MRIVAAEAQLIKDVVEEIEVLACEKKTAFRVYAGRHPTLGKVVIVEDEKGDGVVVEME
jgi:hypothetical protein